MDFIFRGVAQSGSALGFRRFLRGDRGQVPEQRLSDHRVPAGADAGRPGPVGPHPLIVLAAGGRAS